MLIPKHAPSPSVVLVALWLVMAGPGWAQENPYGTGWSLVPEASSLTFQSTKNNSTVETNKFATVTGSIGPDGLAVLKIHLESIDTGIDIRNVRMRFLFFETFKFPEATVTARIDPASLQDLRTVRRKQIPLRFELDLHGYKQTLEATAIVALITDQRVSVTSVTPITIAANLFGFEAGVKKLEEAANVTIVPSGSVSFDLVFAAGVDTAATTVAGNTAIEPAGDFTREECATRFEVVSRAEAIFFREGSAQLDAESEHMLDEVIDVVQRCPDLQIEISGHTDSHGSDAFNQRLSEDRADTVSRYLVESGVKGDRIQTVGFGEMRPAFPNDSAEHRARNRRIEFAVAR